LLPTGFGWPPLLPVTSLCGWPDRPRPYCACYPDGAAGIRSASLSDKVDWLRNGLSRCVHPHRAGFRLSIQLESIL